jgi:hypothetical protein
MKTTFKFLALIALATSLFVTSCVSTKKMKVSQAHIDSLKKDSIETHKKLNEKSAVNNDNTNIVSQNKRKKENKKITIVSLPTDTSLPPDTISRIFNTDYPNASEVMWTLEESSLKNENKKIKNYKVCCLLQGNKSTLIYSEKGKMLEIRIQITQDQLPPNIYTAVKSKYPDHIFKSVSTVKNIKSNGSYIVVITNQTRTEEKEIRLMENGKFVE